MRTTILVLVSLTGLAACSDEAGPTAADVPAGPPAAAAVVGAAVDISGPWSWSERTHIRLREPGVAIFGIAAEGPITHLECEASGDLVIVKNGASFTGTATQSGWCTTRGGQSFDPSGVFPPVLQILDGHLEGRSMSFTVDVGAFPCPYSGSVRVEGGNATELRATGHCEVPREIGGDRIWWSAVRP